MYPDQRTLRSGIADGRSGGVGGMNGGTTTTGAMGGGISGGTWAFDRSTGGDRLTYRDITDKQLRVMDATAIALCRDQNMPVCVFNMNKEGAMMRVMCGEDEGTMVS